MYAIIETGGKQYKVEQGAELYIEKLPQTEGDTVTFDRVLMVNKDGNLKVGSPTVDGASVTAKVDRHGRGTKIVVFKYKRRKNYHKKQGHRQPFTKVVIEAING